MKRQPVQSEEMPVFIGIDYHKAYSVYNVLDALLERLARISETVRRAGRLPVRWSAVLN